MAAGAGLLTGKVAMLQGATGELGAAVVRQLRASGASTALAVRRPWQVDKTIETFGSARMLVGCVPTGDGEAAAGFVKGAIDALGPIDALFCCNGAFRGGAIGKDGGDDLRDLLDANLMAGATLARAVVGPMRRRRTGSLVFVGSAAVARAGAGMANYVASKAALHEWVRVLAVELQDSGVRAAALLPETIDTQKNRAAMPAADHSAWQPLELVARALIELAFAPAAAGPGPLYPVPRSG